MQVWQESKSWELKDEVKIWVVMMGRTSKEIWLEMSLRLEDVPFVNKYEEGVLSSF